MGSLYEASVSAEGLNVLQHMARVRILHYAISPDGFFVTFRSEVPPDELYNAAGVFSLRPAAEDGQPAVPQTAYEGCHPGAQALRCPEDETATMTLGSEDSWSIFESEDDSDDGWIVEDGEVGMDGAYDLRECE